MRFPGFALLALLCSAAYASAEDVVVEVGTEDSAPGIQVSWLLPPGFEESELLLEIEGGPRVRLTDELRGRAPRVVVVLPALSGSARFVVRAGRENEGRSGRRQEIDVARSERFTLAGLPTSGRVPVRAAATRPVPGAVMEWWAEAAGRPAQGPSPTLASPAVAVDADEPLPAPSLPSSRPVPASSLREAATGLEEEEAAASPSSANGPRDRSFTGATTPLRN